MTDTPTVVASGQLTARDVYRFSVMTLRRRFWWFFIIIGFVAAVSVANLAAGNGHWEWNLANLLGPFFLLVFFPYAFFVAPYFAARKMLANTPNLRGTLRYEFSDGGIDIVGPTSRSHQDWPALIEVRETSDLFVFYPQKALGQLMPKHFLPDPAVQSALRQLVRAHVAKVKLQA